MRNGETERLGDFHKIAQLITGEMMTLHLVLLDLICSTNEDGLKGKMILVCGLQGTENKLERL